VRARVLLLRDGLHPDSRAPRASPNLAQNLVSPRLDARCELLDPDLDWTTTLAAFPVKTNEPEEPLLAAMFLKLRWDGGLIDAVELLGAAGLSVHWQDGSNLRVHPLLSAPGLDWLVVPQVSTPDWFVRSEGGEIEGRWPGSP